jgi:hypothetical protein
LLAEFDDPGPYRLIGLGAFDLLAAHESTQLDLLGAASRRAAGLEAVLDSLQDRFGPDAVRRGATLRGQGVLKGDTSLDFLRPSRRGPERD